MSHGDTSAMNQKDHLACERARVKAASSGRNVHGSVQSHLNITKGPGFPANNAKGSFRPGVSVKGKDDLGYG